MITHTHPQAVDGAIAVAVAAAHAAAARTAPTTPEDFLRAVVALTPYGAVRDGLTEAVGLLAEPDLRVAAKVLGNGSRTSAADTVPYALWCAARRLADYPAAVWEAIAAGGDMDTVAAITGGVVAAHTGTAGIPGAWLAVREPLPAWAFPEPGSVHPGDGARLRLPQPHPVPDVLWTDEQWQRIRSDAPRTAPRTRWWVRTREGVVSVHHRRGHPVWEVTVAAVRGGRRPVSALVEAFPGGYAPGPTGENLADLALVLQSAAARDPLRP